MEQKTATVPARARQTSAGALRSGFTPLGMWAFSIGTSIGWGSFIVTCSTYLLKSGVLGTVFGLLIGMAVIFPIMWNLQYTIKNVPDAGGIYAFIKRTRSEDLAFIAYWFILLTYLAILWANVTSVPLFARFFLGNIFRFGFHYTIFGYEVWLGEALLSIAAIALVALFCASSSRGPNFVMIGAAGVFFLGFTVCAAIALFRHGEGFSYDPTYIEGSGAFAQIVHIAVISPWAFIGFENVSHFSEEYRFPAKRIRGVLIGSVLVTTALYIFVSVLSVSAYPPEYDSWLSYIRDMPNLEGIKAVPAFYAANHYLGQTGVTVLMCSLFAVILTSLIGNLLALSRLLYAAGRGKDAPRAFAVLNKKGIPAKAIGAVLITAAAIPFFGRTAIGWIVDVTTLGATMIYGLLSYAVYRHAKQFDRRAEKATGLVGMVLMIAFVLLLLVPGLLPFHAMETVSYILFIVWSLIGLVYFRVLIHKGRNRDYKYRLFVWALLLLLTLFASMMWVSRATEKAANEAVSRIYLYHENHEYDADLKEGEREAFLQEQAQQIAETNTLYSLVSLSFVVLSVVMMFNNYQETIKLGEHLTSVRRIAMKDALTGVKNKHAFAAEEEALNEKIKKREAPEFAIVICDINDLKLINDTRGHNEGDACIRAASATICGIFKHSGVYRVGGDEFAVLCYGYDYEHIERLLKEMDAANRRNKETGGVQIACGMARYNKDASVEAVFDRADRRMYEHKNDLKA